MAKKKAREPVGRLNIPLSAVVYCEGGVWFAHCLELDIVAEGDKPASAIQDLMELSALQIEVASREGDLSSIFSPAPPEIWKMFWMGTHRDSPRKPKKPINRFELRDLELV